MKTSKTVLAATIATLVASTAFAGQIAEGTTGYAARIVDGKEVVFARTYNVGVDYVKTDVKVVAPSNMPAEYQLLNQDAVGKVVYDADHLLSLKVGDIARLDYLGVPKDATVLDRVSHQNGDISLITSTPDGGRTILTFSSTGAVVGTASVDDSTYTITTDSNGGTWMIDDTHSGAAHAGFEHDTHAPSSVTAAGDSQATLDKVQAAEALGATLTVTPKTPTTMITIGTVQTAVPVADVLIYVATSIPNGTTVVNNLVAVTNRAFIDSGVKLQIKAAKVIPVVDQTPLNESTSLSTLASGTYSFATLKADVAAVNPDLIQFIHPLKKQQGMCGLAYLNGGRGTAFSKKFVFSVVSYGTDGGYYCNNWTQAHELGHTMGMVHDAAHSTGVVGHFVDSYGYGLNNTYGDIMSYYPANGYFSTPTKYWNNQTRFPYGVVGKADVVRGLNLVATEVASFNALTK